MLLLFVLLLFLDPNQAQSLLQRGLIALQHGQLTEARENLEQASHADPKNAYIWTSLAETYLRLKQQQDAQTAASEAEQLGATNPVISHALAMFYSDSGNRERAYAFAESAEKQQPSAANRDLLARMTFEYAQMLLRQQDFTRAAEILSSASGENPRNAQLTLALGVARYGQRRFEDSITEFLKVIDIDPEIEQPYVFLGRMLDQAGPRLDAITKHCEAWAARNPQDAEAQLVFAKALLESDSSNQKAETLLRRSIALDPKNWEAHYELGILLAGKHEYKEAAAELTRSIELNPKEPMPHYHLARVYDRLGQPEQAKAEREIHARLTGGANSQ